MSTKRTSSMRAAAARLGRPWGRSAGLVLGLGLCAGFILASALLLSCQKEERTNPLDPKGVRAGSDPFGLTAVETNDGVELTWQVPAGPAIAGLQILRREGSHGEFVIRRSHLGSTTSRYVDCCVVQGGTYFYKVLAVDTEGRTSSESLAEAMGVAVENSQYLPPEGFKLIFPGAFTMGSPTNEPGRRDNETQHQVILTKASYMGVHEVTQAEWVAVMGWNPSSFKGDRRPVETVTWFDCIDFCNQKSQSGGLTPAYSLTNATYSGNHIISATVTCDQDANGYRLPTEAEWEYACRATSTTAFCNGAITHTECSPVDPKLTQVGWYCGN